MKGRVNKFTAEHSTRSLQCRFTRKSTGISENETASVLQRNRKNNYGMSKNVLVQVWRAIVNIM